jgi:hypothetical protein
MAEHESAAGAPEDVDAALVEAAADAIHAFYAAHPENESEEDAIRVLLAAALPLYWQQLRAELAAANERASDLTHELAEQRIDGIARRTQIRWLRAWLYELGYDWLAVERRWQRDAEPADATAAAHSATQTDAEGAQAREDANSSSILPQGLSEAEPCRSCGETYCDDSREGK